MNDDLNSSEGFEEGLTGSGGIGLHSRQERQAMGIVLPADDDWLRVVRPAESGVVDRGGILGGGRDRAHRVLGVEGAHVGQTARSG